MSIKFIPTIAKADYESFRRVINRNLPNTYDEWLYLAAKVSADNVSKGNISNPVELNPDEFRRYCTATGAAPDLQALDNFAYEKGMGNKY